MNDRIAAIGLALSAPARLYMLKALGPDPLKVTDLAARVGICQSTCSHHVRVLVEAGLVEVDPRGAAHFVRRVYKAVVIPFD